MLVRMTVALALAVVIVVAFFFMRSRRKSGEAQVARESTPALDAWIADALEIELAARTHRSTTLDAMLAYQAGQKHPVSNRVTADALAS